MTKNVTKATSSLNGFGPPNFRLITERVDLLPTQTMEVLFPHISRPVDSDLALILMEHSYHTKYFSTLQVAKTVTLTGTIPDVYRSVDPV